MFGSRFEFLLPGRIVAGAGSVAQVGAQAAALCGHGKRRALVIIDSGVAAAGLPERVVSSLREAGVESSLHECPAGEPLLAEVDRCAGEAGRAGVSVLVGLGGGSVLDVAKGAAVVASHGKTIRAYVGRDLVPGPCLPTVLIPTTGGTGAEMTMNSVFGDPATHLKQVVISRHTLASVAVIDPELALSCPPHITACTGADALAHAVEAYTSKNANPMSDMFALEAVRLIGVSLRRAVHDGRDLAARGGMALAASCGGAALQVGAGAVHGLAYPLSARFGLSHGLANALMLAPVTQYNAPAHPAKYRRIAAALGEPTAGMGDREVALRAAAAVGDLLRDVGIPPRLRDAGVAEESLSELAADGIKIRRNLDNNARLLTEVADALAIYRAAW